MDSYEATKVVFSRIQNLDPENASKIMGYLLLQDNGDKEMIRLAFGPETLLQSLILQAKTHLCLTPITPISTPSTPSSNSWPLLSSNNNHNNNNNSSTSSLSYASVVNGAGNNNNSCAVSSSVSSGVSLSSTNTFNGSGNDLIDEYQLQDHFSFLNDAKADDLIDSRPELGSGFPDTLLHRRSFSVPGMCFGAEDATSGFGWKPCLYFARGFCKNGTNCRFLHGADSVDAVAAAAFVGSPSKLNEFERCQELLRSKAAAAIQQQRLAAASQFMSGAGSSFPYNKCMNFLLQQQNDSPRSAAAAALMMGDELHKFGRCRPDRNDFSHMGLGMNPGARQIYLTFPADSTFREEDVSNYFSIYGPVQDVRIPYQQKRMFGFVTFVYPETVKLILAKGNPHFVCDSRVLVKPYKEKGKVPDKKQQHQQQQQMDRGEYSACSSPSGIDSRDSFDLHLGARMLYNTQEILLRRKLEEQADLQQAIELHGRRLMNLQLLDIKTNNHHHHHHHHNHHQYIHNLTSGSPIPSPTLSHAPNNQGLIFPVDGIDQELPEENGGNPDAAAVSQNAVADADLEVNPASNHNTCNSNSSISKEEYSNTEESNILESSLEHILPDNLFTSPKKSAGDHMTVFSTTSVEVDENNKNVSSPITTSASSNSTQLMSNSTLSMATLKSCFLQMPRFASGQGTIGM